MARAKQTNRADARRRYRQALAEADEQATDAADGESQPEGASGRGASGRPPATAGPARPGFLSAFRNAYHQPNYRADLAAVPTLVRGRWFLISVGLVVAGFVALIVYPSSLTLFVFQTVTSAPAVLPLFLVGFTAPRASYLLGLMVAVVDIPLSIVGAGRLYAISGIEFPLDQFLLFSILPGLPVAAILASAAAWYRRFLQLSNPRRQQASRSRSSKGGRKAAARR